MGFDLREHTADVAIEAEGETVGETFAAVGDGLAAAQCDSIPEAGERFAVEVRAEGKEALLFDFLDRLIYERDVRGVLPADHEATVGRAGADEESDGGDGGAGAGETGDGEEGDWIVRASARGVPLGAVRAREVKAVTYSEMRLEQRAAGWYAYVVLDV